MPATFPASRSGAGGGVWAAASPRPPARHGQPSPASGARYLPAQYCNLMPEHQDLRLLSGVAPRQEHQPAGHPDHEDVYETNEHERRAQSSRSGPCAGFWHGTGEHQGLGRAASALVRLATAHRLLSWRTDPCAALLATRLATRRTAVMRDHGEHDLDRQTAG